MALHLAKSRANNSVIYTRAELAELLGVTEDFVASVEANPAEFYRSFSIPKRSGGSRLIEPPTDPLKVVQRRILAMCYDRLRIPTYLHGGLPKRSSITHARPHVGKNLVATLDIRDFYPSTTRAQIEPVLRQARFSADALTSLISLVTLNDRLPQGSPSSCFLANMSLALVERSIWKWCRSRELTFTRFIDDIAISGNWDFASRISGIVESVESKAYQIATEKSSKKSRGERQVVTGLVVNEKLRPTKSYIADVKHDIRLCLEIGPDLVANVDGISVSKLKNRLNGRIAHIRRFDEAQAAHFGRMMCGVEWTVQGGEYSWGDIDRANAELSWLAASF